MDDFKMVLGLDYGRRKMGAAIGQKATGATRPLSIIHMKEREPDWLTLDEIVAEWKPDIVVIGKPTNLDGSPHTLELEIEKLGSRISNRYETTVCFVDEHLSSQMAIEKRKSKKKPPLDSIAAGLILETWFDEQENY
jgi:RNAse H-fold protein YqgF